MRYTTLHYRLKDATTGKHLTRMSHAVNYVWNYCNEVNAERWAKFRKTYTAFDLMALTAGCSKGLGLPSKTIDAVCDEFIDRCKQYKKVRLNWRSRKRSLGWIPFKGSCIKVVGDTIVYRKKTFRFWLSRPLTSKVRFGSFSQDAQGHWYVNFVVEDTAPLRPKTGKQVGVDLGLKSIATLSDGVSLNRQNLTKKYEQQLAAAQRAHKKRRVTAIHTKIKNTRKDWTHKATTRLVNTYDRIVVGNVSSTKLIKTRLAKSVSDAGWHSFKTMLVYKAVALGVEVKEVNESFSTVTCSACQGRTGPTGAHSLGVREWVCSQCGTLHDRDVNAARNILTFSVRDI